MKTAQSRQKAYVDQRRRPLKFSIGDKVFVIVFPIKRALRINRKSKLDPRFVVPFEILDKVEPVAYRLALPPELENIRNVFHISQL